MLTLETAIRLIVIGQEILLGLVFLFGTGRRSARVAGALLLFGVAGYLLRSSPELSSALVTALPLLSLASVATSYCLWLFARCIFDEPLPRRWIIALFVAIGLVCWLIFVFEDRVSTRIFETANAVLRATSVVIVVNTLWLALRGRGDDLLEKRRLFRTIFVVAVAVQTLIVLSVELVLGIELPPPVMSLINVVMIGVITMVLAVMVLRLSADFFPEPAPCSAAAEYGKSAPPLPAADRVLLDKLIAAMDAGLYRQTGLTITALAAELGYPEHRLRKLINRRLGFRNFSFFVNSFRIEEATERLGDPAQARTPVLTIALDLGFASLGPFNRAFKELTGMTPTAYREQAIPANSR